MAKVGLLGSVTVVGLGIVACNSKNTLLMSRDGASDQAAFTGGALGGGTGGKIGTGGLTGGKGTGGLAGTGAGGSGGSTPDSGLSRDQVVRACVLAASCGAPGSSLTPSGCIAEFAKTASRWDDTMLNHLLTCANAVSCAEFRSCWGGGLLVLGGGVVNAACVENAISVELIKGVTPAQFDCGAIAGQCVLLATGSIIAYCNVRPCCSPDPFKACEGATASGCDGSCGYTRVDCARSGRVCRIDGNHAVCAGTGASCDESERVTCAGSVATFCSNGARATLDCATTKFATGCAAGATSNEPCTAAGKDCDPVSFVGRCNGTTFQICVDGSIATFDCQSIGFPLCDLPSIGSARCREGI